MNYLAACPGLDGCGRMSLTKDSIRKADPKGTLFKNPLFI